MSGSATTPSPSMPRPPVVHRLAPHAWTIFLSVLILAPVLLPGYVLSYDMVFTPQQSLLPWMFGIDSGLPRAVPQDPFIGLIAGPIPGEIVQKIVLFGALILAGTGANRVLRTKPLAVRLAAISLVLWNPFVAERLVIGHWALLLAYGAAPWVLVQVVATRRGQRSASTRLVATVALGCLVPSGAILMVLLAAPALFFRSLAKARDRVLVAAALLIFASTWGVAAILNPNATSLDAGSAAAFALRPENWSGAIGAALAGAGNWNAEVVPASRGLPWIPLVGLAVVVLALLGRRQLSNALDALVTNWLLILAGLGFCWSLLATWHVSQPMMTSLMGGIPGGGVLRDGQKLLIPLVLFTALAAPLGLAVVLKRARASIRFRNLALVGLLIVPLAVLPDMALGGWGKLGAVAYPASWGELRQQIEQSPDGDAISLPWGPFRRYDWNSDRTVLDPMPRYLPITVLTDDRLPVATKDGVVFIAGDNPRSAGITAVIADGGRLVETLPSVGVRYVIEQTDQPGQINPEQLVGLELVARYPGLRLWSVGADSVEARPTSGLTLSAALNLGALAIAVGAWVAVGIATYGGHGRREAVSADRSGATQPATQE
ncbi:MAG: hypothetical protein HQ526_07135 [Actinobacteria bacterium]|nr:hypothetical protein [Actinomycetota bacterium]